MSTLSILIVEDEGIVAEDLANKVRQLGYGVAGITASGEEAVELARKLQPALVLMDIRLAGAIDGITAAQMIHLECHLPVLFLTAHSDAGTVERARQAKAFGYILKPFNERELHIQIKMALYRHAAERQLHESKERLKGVNQILQAALTCETEEDLGRACLEIVKKITQSQYGFISEINKVGLEDITISNSGREAYNSIEPCGHCKPPGNFKIHGISGQVLLGGKSLFTNDLANHPDSIGLPEKHPPLTSFLGVPLIHDGSVIGLLAVGNCEGGYSQAEQESLEALTPSIVEAFLRKRVEDRLRVSVDELKATNSKLLDSRRATINMMQDAILARQQTEEVNIQLEQEVAERKKVAAELQLLNRELEHRVERRTLELQETQKQYLHAEKLSAIGKLSASIAHEFNNPLQGIQSVLKGLKKRAVLEAEDRQLLEEAIEESNRIRDLIRDLQDFNRPSSSTKGFLNVHKTLDAVLLLHKNDFKGKRISLVLDYAEQLPQIEAVSDQIKQVFLNMLTNAADACLQPGGVITVSTRLENQEMVAVAIKDNGIGIKPSDMDLIFQPFFTTKSEVKGTGLGLSVSHGIIANHQGEIHVESELGKGTTFTILLPIKGAVVTS